jgi:hypothetical protein
MHGSRQTRTADPLALDDDGNDEAEEEGGDSASSSRRPRARNQRAGDIPVVKDATGEKVLESFEVFLKTYVMSFCAGLYCYLKSALVSPMQLSCATIMIQKPN